MPGRLAQLAELLEDGGSFFRGPPSAPNQPRITFASAYYDEVKKVADLLRVKYIRTQVRRYRGAGHPFFHVQLKASRAVRLMKQLRPLMSSDRQQAIDFALEGVIPLTRHDTEAHRKKVALGLEPRVGGRAYRSQVRRRT